VTPPLTFGDVSTDIVVTLNTYAGQMLSDKKMSVAATG
jgi:hypothetical protein